MRILLIHSQDFIRGDEDASVEVEAQLLRGKGHDVELLLFDNAAFEALPLWKRLKALFSNHLAVKKVQKILTDYQPDVVHLHNIFYYASPGIIKPIHKAGLPLVMTLHNDRLLRLEEPRCGNEATGEDSGKKRCSISGVLRGFCQESCLKSLFSKLSLRAHRVKGTYRLVNTFFVLSDFAKKRFVSGASKLPEVRCVIKHNSTNPQPYAPHRSQGTRFLFVGPLRQTDIDLLLAIFEDLDIHLDIIGEEERLQKAEKSTSHIQFHGKKDATYIQKHVSAARALLLPSSAHEGLPNVLMEACAHGTPIIYGDDLASLEQFLRHDENGLRAAPDINSWKEAVRRISTDDELCNRLSEGAYATYQQFFTHERNTAQLIDTYQAAINEKKRD